MCGQFDAPSWYPSACKALPVCFPLERESTGGDDMDSRSRVVPESISLSAPPLEVFVSTEKPSAERGFLHHSEHSSV